jgi:hypothetical protein
VEQKGYVGLTDPDWSAYLTSPARVDEVNFWQPHGGRAFRALRPGDPFFVFDRGYVTVTPDYEFRAGESLRADFSNGRTYYPLNGGAIRLLDDLTSRPSREHLEWHQSHVFRG